MTPTLPAEQALDETDGIHLRRAIELANVARSRGNR
ncbi:tRNA-specific adenosine deaminase, partial [Bacillus subtilis]